MEQRFKLEQSAGAVLVTRQDGRRYYVLVEECVNSALGLPKGHQEPGETLAEAALREIWEEAGVRARLVPGAPVQETEYDLSGGVRKHVTYFVAAFDHQVPHPHPEDAGGVRIHTLEQLSRVRLNHVTTLHFIQNADAYLAEHPEVFDQAE
ncbi:MAG: NUDIX domain-containing protein [Clostridia bacterium]|nr:NUDIX domain-containing protein [Clostridia bacterium]